MPWKGPLWLSRAVAKVPPTWYNLEPQTVRSVRHKYRAVIFDAGGTLIGQDDPLGFEKDLSAAFGALGVSVTAQQIQALMPGLQTAATRRRKRIGGWSRTPEEDRQSILWVGSHMLESLGVTEDIEGKATAIYGRFAAGEFIGLFSDVKPTLERLTQTGITMGVLSNYAPFLERNLRVLDIHRYFAFLVVSSLVGFEKPDPRIFQMAMQEARCPHEDILYVGDSLPDDVEGAKGVGLDVVLLDRFDRFPDADCQRIRSLGQLLDIVA